ncbi:MAG: AAA family ATPase [Dysgonamonadaceae bacterium]|jgi:hypothetical protein|nr:AAA family ATPase [Dysgonamonadaceae bacterium]
MSDTKILRIFFKKFLNSSIIAENSDNFPVIVSCTGEQSQEFESLLPYITEGSVFNLLNVTVNEEESGIFVSAEFIILEPDYLIDISSLAECFRPYGNNEFNYTFNRIRMSELSPAILLGNAANFFLDELINADNVFSINYDVAMKKLFASAAFEFTICNSLQDGDVERKFFDDCKRHFDNIFYIVNNFFRKTGIERENVILEPSFVCNALGIHGRLDLMLNDFSAFVELKSGKSFEDFRNGGAFIRSAENHYTQMILYLATLEFNLSLNHNNVRSYLLYSKYPVMSLERHSRKQLNEALKIRNKIVGREFAMQKSNNFDVTFEFLSKINSHDINTAGLTGKFFTNYLAPPVDRFANALANLNESEKSYFIRLYNFLIKEVWVTKCGERDYEGIKRACCLWNVGFNDKVAAGELLYDLKIIENLTEKDEPSVKLSLPQYQDLYLPNFRVGDSVVLYERNGENDTVNNHQVFRGAIECLESESITVRLRYKQKNRSVWKPDSMYAVEHDSIDSTFSGMFRALGTFLFANDDRKRLISGDYFGMENKKQDVRLIIGPPGTGKTSIAMKNAVEAELKKPNSNILLLSFTNRAVDEICKALSEIENLPEYIRISSKLNCSPEFRRFLLENRIEKCKNRRDVIEMIGKCRIFVGTAASFWSKNDLFNIKHFDLAIIDEATQMLEPHLVGFFCLKTGDNCNAIDEFILIGDHKQLPAIVLQSRDDSKVRDAVLNDVGLTNLGDSLFERFHRQIMKHGNVDLITMLTRQGRMHPHISAFPSEYFYEGLLECAGLPHQKEEYVDKRLQFFDVVPSDKDYFDKANVAEAEYVTKICIELYDKCLESGDKFDPASVGIITPYRNQIALIRKMLQDSGKTELSQVIVDTVERFQGSQRDIIIYSFCVKTGSGLISLSGGYNNGLDRKLNVAITRARKRLFLVGNRKLLEKNDVYRKLIEHVNKM